MKTTLTLCSFLICLALLAGCSDSTKKSTSDNPPKLSADSTPPPPPPPAPSANNDNGHASDLLKQAKDTVKKQAAETASAIEKEGAALSSQLTSSLQTSSDPTLKAIASDLGSRVSKLAESLKDNQSAQTTLTNATDALLKKDDIHAISSLGNLTEAKLTPEQTTLAKDVYNAAAALVTQRNFSGLEGVNSDVATLVNSVWKGNYTEALPPLQKIWSQAKLTDSQKNLLGTTFDKYVPGWRDSAAKVQQGLDTIKGLTK